MNGENERPFADLPAALVEEMLIRTEPLSQRMQADFERLRAERHQHRQALEESGILRREGELPAVSVPTTCGVDGAYALERLVATDLVAAAAVAVGITRGADIVRVHDVMQISRVVKMTDAIVRNNS